MSSAETATEIKTHLTSLRKSRTLRSRKNADIAALDRSDALTLDKLRRIFGRLREDGCFFSDNNNTSGGNESASAKWTAWLNTQRDQYLSILAELILDDKVYALRTFCGDVANFPNVITVISNDDDDRGEGKREILSEKLLTKLLEAVFKSKKVLRGNTTAATSSAGSIDAWTADEALLDMLNDEFIRQYRDVQYYVLMVVQKLSLQLLEGIEKKKRGTVTAADGSGDDDEEEENELEQNAQVVAENMARLLLKMDYIAKSEEDLNGDASFLFPLAVLNEAEVENEEEDHAETESESDSSGSESSDNEDNKQRPSLPTTMKTTRRTKKAKLSPVQKAYNHRNLLQEAWLSVLRLPIPPRTTKQILQHLSTYILTIVPTPLRFAEYFTRSFRAPTTHNNNANNSLIAVLSLHGLFQLILNHQLEYPQFYPSLYKLLHPRILYTKHRSRFLRLLSKSLMSNTMLPAYVVAAFCKKLLRLGLSGPPSGALFVLALVSNLIRKHGEVGCLIHRKGGEMEDVFCEDAEDLMATRALESSLWELVALQKHYHPAVSALAASCGTEDDKTPMYDMEDFMVHTYKSLFEQEKKRIAVESAGKGDDSGVKRKKARVSLTFVEPKGLFCEGDVFAGAFRSH